MFIITVTYIPTSKVPLAPVYLHLKYNIDFPILKYSDIDCYAWCHITFLSMKTWHPHIFRGIETIPGRSRILLFSQLELGWKTVWV